MDEWNYLSQINKTDFFDLFPQQCQFMWRVQDNKDQCSASSDIVRRRRMQEVVSSARMKAERLWTEIVHDPKVNHRTSSPFLVARSFTRLADKQHHQSPALCGAKCRSRLLLEAFISRALLPTAAIAYDLVLLQQVDYFTPTTAGSGWQALVSSSCFLGSVNSAVYIHAPLLR